MQLVSVQAVAKALGCHIQEGQIRRRLESDPKFPRPVPGGRMMFVESEVREYQECLLQSRGSSHVDESPCDRIQAKHIRNGRKVKSVFFSLRFKLPGEARSTTIPLRVRDEQVAESKRLDFVREHKRELLSDIIPPKCMRDAAERSVADHLAGYVAEKIRVGKDRMYVYNIERQSASWSLSVVGSGCVT